jgi:aminoglycoside phosphotransferase (APT) family kinase protein
MCRGDARFANFIRRPDGRVGLVDWEDSGLRDPAREIADIITAANQEDLVEWDDWQVFLRSYLEGRYATDPQLACRVDLYLAIFPIMRIVIQTGHGLQRIQTGVLDSWTINDMAPNLRLRRYLARTVAWPDPHFDTQLAALEESTVFPDATTR